MSGFVRFSDKTLFPRGKNTPSEEIRIPLDRGAEEVISRLNEKGFEAYAVGGCVRDRLLGKTPGDYDIASSATPDEVRSVFSGRFAIPTGLKHGTVTVCARGGQYEVTAFRTEGEYLDGRRPSSVAFVRDLKEDLARRDFTFNALAWHPDRGLIDLYGGLSDLNRGVVRTVGDPVKRFSEDALRILRAVRFASVLGFAVEEETARAALKERKRLALVSSERKAEELKKLILGDNVLYALTTFSAVITEVVPELSPCVGFAQNTPWHRYDVYEHTARSVSASPKDLCVRLAMLLHDIGKPESYTEKDGIGHFYGHEILSAEKAKIALDRLKFDNKTKATVLKLIANHSRGFPESDYKFKKMFGEIGREDFFRLIAVKYADNAALGTDAAIAERQKIAEAEARAEKLCASGELYCEEMLNVSGADLLKTGLSGKEIGEALRELTDAAMRGEVKNERESLLAFAEKRRKKKGDGIRAKEGIPRKDG